jgi:hypothetical protein
MAQSSKIIKVAGLSFVGFCAVSLVADKVAFGPEASQIAGYCGAFLGALAGRGRSARKKQTDAGIVEAKPAPAPDVEVVSTSSGV